MSPVELELVWLFGEWRRAWRAEEPDAHEAAFRLVVRLCSDDVSDELRGYAVGQMVAQEREVLFRCLENELAEEERAELVQMLRWELLRRQLVGEDTPPA